MRVDFPLAHSLRKGSHQRHSGRLSRFLIVADVPVIDNIHAPVVFRLAVNGSTAFNADVDEVFAEKQPIGVERCVLLCAEQRGSGLDPEPDVTAEVNRAAGVVARRQVDDAAASFGAGVDGLLNGGPGVVRLLPRCSVILDVKNVGLCLRNHSTD